MPPRAVTRSAAPSRGSIGEAATSVEADDMSGLESVVMSRATDSPPQL